MASILFVLTLSLLAVFSRSRISYACRQMIDLSQEEVLIWLPKFYYCNVVSGIPEKPQKIFVYATGNKLMQVETMLTVTSLDGNTVIDMATDVKAKHVLTAVLLPLIKGFLVCTQRHDLAYIKAKIEECANRSMA